MKRTHSESETDDIYSGDEKDGDETCGGVSRKRRRGIIEKRRRDRINNSLSELRRLVPAAFEKQGSAKLEKAEILQMTVDHLKMLHNKGLDALAYDPNKFAMDYHNIGFRECAAEVARYMVAVEGLDIQDPLRLRLMSHLQCFSTQRELATKQTAPSWGWGATHHTSPVPSTAAYPNTAPISSFQGHMLHPQGHHTSPPSIGLDHQSHSAFSAPSSSNDISTSTCNSLQGVQGLPSHRIAPSMPITPPSSMAPPSSMTAPTSQANYHLNLNAFPVNHSGTSHLGGTNNLSTNQINHPYPTGLQGSSGVKPYRPWGAEIAY